MLKVEWNNVGFYDDLSENGVSSDFKNFQLWLYEGTNAIEIRFGNNSVNNPSLVYDQESGAMSALLKVVNNDDSSGEALMLVGDQVSPDLTEISLDEFQTNNALLFLNRTIPNGTMYQFSKLPTGVSENQNIFTNVSVYPNPTSDDINISLNNVQEILNTVLKLNLNGQVIKEFNKNTRSCNISDLSPGVYFVEINTQTNTVTKRLIKK